MFPINRTIYLDCFHDIHPIWIMNSFCSINSSKLAFTLPSKKKKWKKKISLSLYYGLSVWSLSWWQYQKLSTQRLSIALLLWIFDAYNKVKKRDAIDYTEDRYDNPLVKKESPSKKEKKANKLQIVSPNYYFLVGLLFCFTFFFCVIVCRSSLTQPLTSRQCCLCIVDGHFYFSFLAVIKL